VVIATLIRSRRVLLLNPPIVDLRVPWAEWLEPTGLLKIGTVLREQDNDVHLLDCFRSAPLRRQLDATIDREGQTLNRWRFGLRSIDIVRALQSLKRSNWIPDRVLITTRTSFWWLGIPIAVAAVRKVFPDVTVILGGVYPDQAPKHAEQFGEVDQIGDQELTSAAVTYAPAIDLYNTRIASVAVTELKTLGVDRTMTMLDMAVKQGATRIHLADHAVATESPNLLADLLERLARSYPRTRLFVLGEISAREIVAWPELPALLRAARCRQLVLSDNRYYPVGKEGEANFVTDVRQAMNKIIAAGFRARTDDCGVQMAVGRLGETPENGARLLAHLSPVAGSVIPVPFQPTLNDIGADDPWETNGKLFPLAQRNGSSFMAYMELLGLCAVANAKHRTRTFDFAEDSVIARSLRRALLERAWDPHGIDGPRELAVLQNGG